LHQQLNLEKLYQDHSKAVFNIALQYVQNAEEAEEITQDVFLKVHEKMDGFRNEAKLSTWIFRITVNQSLDYLKKRNSKKRYFLFKSVSIDDNKNLSNNFNHPGAELESKEEVKRIFECLNALPDKYKSVIILLKIEGYSIKETAEIMELSYKAVESIFQRAKKALKEKLDEKEGN